MDSSTAPIGGPSTPMSRGPAMRLSVRTKLFGAFGVVIVLMVVLGVASISKLDAVNSKAVHLGTKSVNSEAATGEVLAPAANYRRVQNRLVFPSAAEAARFQAQLGPYLSLP